MPQKYILVINAGSATLKFKIFDLAKLQPAMEGIVERIGLMGSFIKIGDKKEIVEVENHEQAFKLVLANAANINGKIVAVGHRVVHGGEEFTQPTLITAQIIKKLEKYNQLAPLHNPVGLDCIEASRKYLKNIPDVAIFDTAFYKTLPRYAFLYALPIKYYQKYKIRRYGFHGISHQYVAEQAAWRLKKPLSKLNLITCHLGSGCSITAIKNGQAVDTSMGFTPLEGLVMSTRSGSIDPAICLYLMRRLKMTADEIDDLLNKHSGLFGLSGSLDMREILIKAGYAVPGFKLKGQVKAKDKAMAKLTLEIFIYNIKKYIGAYSSVLKKVDALIFTAGIGERSPLIRGLILKDFPKFKALVIPTNEELMIASQVKKFFK